MTTDLIVGFPGESDIDFDESLAVVAEADFDSAYTFIFSPREGTRAAEMVENFVDADVIADRFQRLKDVLDRSALRHHEAREGRREEVLVEGPSKRNDQMLSGRTRQGKLIHFAPAQHALRPGALVQVEVTHGAPYHLLGDVVSLERGPRHKVRLPLVNS